MSTQESHSDDSGRSQHTAGILLLALITAGVIGVSAANITLMALLRDQSPTVPQIVRFALTCLLMLMIWCGFAWAQWLAVVLFGLSAVLAMVPLVIAIIAGNPIGIVLALVMAAVYGITGILLAFDTPVSRYLRARRD